ncbi:hypothetical protein ACQP2F_44820 [Actinoplanes sp. CA-030573]|uniref:hypothetical protein n=1 Tax=Actinoplanes sp. CA-030573 TaxID=3239898 RepID=UPI003D90F783
MIDLDQPAQYRTPPNGTARWLRLTAPKALLTIVLASLLAGAILGGVATYIWRYKPLAASMKHDESAVAVLLFAEPDTMTMTTKQRRVHLEAQVTVVNAGPALLNVRAVRVDQPGVTVRSADKERQIPPATALPIDVAVDWNCPGGEPTVLTASVSVETADEQPRNITPVALGGTPWLEAVRTGCAGS